MKLLFLIIFALFLSCSTEPEDCAGVTGGIAEEDMCGVCDSDATNDCVQDCLEKWGGIASIDECGTCDTDESNDCTQDCADIWGGTAVVDECGVCGGDNSTCTGCIDESACNYAQDATISDDICSYPEVNFDCDGNCLLDFNCAGMCLQMDSILPDFESMYNSSKILQMCSIYNSIFSSTFDVELPSNNLSYIFYDEIDLDCHVLISAPHSQRTWRYYNPYSNDCSDNEEHERDLRTGVIAKILNELSGCPSIVKKYQSDDPNYHHKIPDCTNTDVFINSVGELLPYKQKILNYISQNESISFVIDIHGWQRTGDVDMGTMYGESIESEVGQCLPSLIQAILENRGISSSQDYTYSASQNETVTKFVRNYINRIIDAIQLEIESDYRSCSSDRFSEIIYALLEIIFISNYIYELNITNF